MVIIGTGEIKTQPTAPMQDLLLIVLATANKTNSAVREGVGSGVIIGAALAMLIPWVSARFPLVVFRLG